MSRSWIGKARGDMLATERALGDVQAVKRAARTRSAAPLLKRGARRLAGRETGRLLGRLFR